MKKINRIIYIVITTLLLTGCEKNVFGDFEIQETDYSTEVGLSKKGNAYTYNAKAWSHRTHNIGSHWFYHWGNVPREELPENVEYVPMFWGKKVTDEDVERLKQLAAEGKIKYLLGFNEPDGITQSNVTVDEAIAVWHKLEEVGVPLISPAVVGDSSDNPWMIEFMEKVEQQGLRVDYIGFHSYPGPNVGSFMNRLRKTYEAYKRPIWITEFAVADWKATNDENNKHSEAQVLEFMKEVLPALDKIEWISRYAWFDDSDHSRPALASSRLFDDEGNLTMVGQFYAQHNPNALIGPGMDTEYIPPVDDDELIFNGHFEGGTWENTQWSTWNTPNGWDGYQSDAVSVDVTDAYTGFFSARLQHGSSALQTVVEVEANKTYVYKLHSKWAEDKGHKQKIVFKDHIANKKIANSDALSSTADWTEFTGEITIPSGVSKLRIILWNDKQTHFYFDDISLKEKI
ncbi:carbohydrate binding domain-containing protein [Polaribacter pectinis]|uniref:Carbohydrate binding domain-containing protein n=1 Tax=Polaribacter pectinis TaxID=2738844 RepID=A0A7G9L6Q6_9FLAO|nr:glycosyl hydrolase [Polaribacter pectinis]QNM84305.1 carbohydrate binding domain-containing protein [Polaribacter pectinis]